MATYSSLQPVNTKITAPTTPTFSSLQPTTSNFSSLQPQTTPLDQTLAKAGVTSAGIIGQSKVGQSANPAIPTPLLPTQQTSPVIPATSLTSTTPTVKLPPPPVQTPVPPIGNTYDAATGMYSSGNATIPQAVPYPTGTTGTTGTATGTTTTSTTGTTPTSGQGTSLEGLLTEYLNGSTAAPSLEAQYKQAQQESGILQTQQQLRDAQAQLGDLSQRAGAASLSQGLRSKANVLGAISGAQADIQRKAAIEALPLQANIQALQGNVDAAQKNLDMTFKLKSEDAANEYNRMKEQRAAVYQFATDAQKAKLETQQKEADRRYEESKTLSTEAQNWAKTAFDNNQPTLAAKLSAIDPKDPNARQKIAELTAGLVKKIDPLESLKIQNQILENKKLQQEINKANPTTVSAEGKAAATNIMAITDAILNDPYLDNAVGLKTPGAWFNGFFGSMYGSPTQNVINNINQLKGTLSLDNRSKLKGSGAISDFEAKTLEKAASAFDTNLSNVDAVKQLKQIKGVAATASGLATPITIRNPQTGESTTISANRAGIESAIADGMIVEYQ